MAHWLRAQGPYLIQLCALAVDYERTTSSSEAMIKVSSIHLMLNRLRPDPNATIAKFTYKPNPMKKAAQLLG
jgi:hypothetical protein